MIRRTVALIGVLLLVCACAYSQENAVPDEEYLGLDAAVGRPGIAAEAAEEFVPPPVLVAEPPVSNVFVKLQGVIGVFVLLGIAWLFSNNKKKIPWRVICYGIGLQVIFATLILQFSRTQKIWMLAVMGVLWFAGALVDVRKGRVQSRILVVIPLFFIILIGVLQFAWITYDVDPGPRIFVAAKAGVEKLLSFTDAGASFLFNRLYNCSEEVSGQGFYQLHNPKTGQPEDIGMVFAFHVLMTIIFFASLMAILYHIGFMQKMVKVVAWVMVKTMGTSGAESLSCAANIFVGQTEAPLVVKPFVREMTMSELIVIMTGGFATVAGGVLAAYVRFGIPADHLMAASVMSAPAAIVMAKIMIPETKVPKTAGGAAIEIPTHSINVIDAAASGAGDGLRLALNVGAMLMAFLSLVYMLNFFLGHGLTPIINWVLGLVGTSAQCPELSLKLIFGYFFAPISWCMGVSGKDILEFGELLGTKISINEFVAYDALIRARSTLSPRTFIIGTYALCGFANLGSIGIQLGGIGAIAPNRRHDLARIGVKAMIAGALASWLTATIAGILL